MPTATRTERRTRTYVPSGDIGRKLNEARALQLQIQQLTAEYDALRAQLRDHCLRNKLTEVQLGRITALLKERARWTYSPETEREMSALQVTQKWEQQRGIATNDPTLYISLSESK